MTVDCGHGADAESISMQRRKHMTEFELTVTVSLTKKFATADDAIAWMQSHSVLDMMDQGATVRHETIKIKDGRCHVYKP